MEYRCQSQIEYFRHSVNHMVNLDRSEAEEYIQDEIDNFFRDQRPETLELRVTDLMDTVERMSFFEGFALGVKFMKAVEEREIGRED